MAADKPQAASIAPFPVRRTYTDAELVAGLRDGDSRAAMAFFDAYGDLINSLVWKLLRSGTDHDDVVATVLMAVVKNIRTLKDPQCLSKWVSTVTVNTVRSEIRKRQLRRRFFVDVSQPEELLPATPARSADIAARVMAVVRTMKPEHQIVFSLHYMEEYSFSEVAELLSCSLSTAKRMGRRCKREFLQRAAKDAVLAGYIEVLDENADI